jgi:hypothetical protein
VKVPLKLVLAALSLGFGFGIKLYPNQTKPKYVDIGRAYTRIRKVPLAAPKRGKKDSKSRI